MEQSYILVVDDNPEIREVTRILLEGEGYQVEEAKDGEKALEKIRLRPFDLIILDVMMPNLNGYQTCVEIRKISNAPILFLSAKTQDSDKTMGFLSGGDDYLPKPFSYNELIGRAKALIRRYQVYKGKEEGGTQEKLLHIRHVDIDEKHRQVFVFGELTELTETEFQLLVLFAGHPGQIFSAQHLYEAVWKEPYYYGANNTVMVHIRNLRKKIEEDPQNPVMIKTVWGKGYRCD